MKLKDKVAFITGGSSGIGAAIARRFAKEGAKVAVAASNDLAKAQAVVRSIEGEGGRAWACACDVRSRAAIEQALRGTVETFGPVDIVVNSAGVYYATPIGKTSAEDAERMIGRGKIINFASVAAVMGVRERSLYCGTKAAVAQMTRALARELAPFNVNINAIAPGNTATPMNEKVRTDPAYAQQLAGMEAATPSQRTYSEPDDIAAVALFLASDESRAMHGAVLLADEGISTGLG
jgi:3-oxoacyl-[acyl-carrier protein] reductase